MIPPPAASDPADPAFWGGVVLVGVLVLVGVFDAVALASGGRVSTISAVVQEWARQYPMVGVIAGIVIGHLFFPARHP